MTAGTKKIIIISIILFLAVLLFAGFIFYEIFKQGRDLEEQKITLAENKNKEAEFFGIQRLLRETESERAVLAENFFRDQNDMVVFLDGLDKIARDFNLVLETDSLEKSETEEKIPITKISFSFAGNQEKIVAFSELLENIPHHSFLESLNLKQADGVVWKGKAVLVVTMHSF